MEGARPRVLIATFEGGDEAVSDDPRLVTMLAGRGVGAQTVPWTQPGVDWDEADLVWVRSTWDYTRRLTEWLSWLAGRGAGRARLENDAALLAWNSDKRYLADLAAAGVPTVPTVFVAPGDDLPHLSGEVVVKPSVSAGGRDTGRFGPRHHDQARALVASIAASSRTAMIQPYLGSVDRRGETAVVVVDGHVSHVLRKRSVLRPDELAPLRDDPLGVAEAMYDPDLVRADPGGASPAEHALVQAVLAEVRQRLAVTPLQMRVDMVADDAGSPVLLELEAVEPHLYLDQVDDAAAVRLVDAVLRRLPARGGPPAAPD